MTVSPCKHQMRSIATVLNDYLESVKIDLSFIVDNISL